MCVCRYGWRLMRGKTKSLFSLNFFSKNSHRRCECPIKLHSHLLAAYPRSVGGLVGLSSLRVWGFSHQAVKTDLCWERVQLRSFLAALKVRTSFTRCQERWWLLCFLYFVTIVLFFSLCTRSSSSLWHSRNFSLRHRFFHFAQRNTALLSHGGKEAASFKLSAKSKLYVHDTSEAVLTALCLLSLSKAHCSSWIFLRFCPYSSSQRKALFYQLWKKKRKKQEYSLFNRTKQMEETAAYGCACQESACVEEYRS